MTTFADEVTEAARTPSANRHQTLLARARELQKAGDLSAALALYERIVLEDPTHGPAQFGVGTCAQLLRQPERALHAYASAQPAFPGNAAIPTRMAHLQRQLGRLEEARATYHRARALNPDDAHLAVGLAQVESMLGDDVAALATLDEAGLQDSELRAVTAQRARCHLGLGEFDQARDIARSLPASTTSEATVRRLLLSDIASARWDLIDAEHHLAEAVQSDPTNPMLRLRHAGRLLSLLLPAAAMGELSQRAALVPGRPGSDIRPRATQGLFADIANEFLLDQASLDEARRALLGDDVPRAARLVRASPGSLAAACALLVTLRRCDLLRADAPLPHFGGADDPDDLDTVAHDRGSIPRHVIQAWFGSAAPVDVELISSTWRRRHGWRYTRLDDRGAVAFLEDEVGPDAVSAFRQARHPAARADLVRLAWLAAFGGVWADADDSCRAPLDPVIEGRSLVLWQEDRGNLANDLMAAAPGHPAIVAARDEAIRNLNDHHTESTWLATGPGLVTRAVAGWLASNLETLGTATLILDRHELRRNVVPGLPLPYKSTGTYWLHAESAR